MNKKTVSLILIFTIFFSIIAMAVWGKQPETSSDVYVTSMVFLDQEGQEITTLNNSDLHEKKVTLKRDDENVISYTFKVKLLPENATDLTIDAAIQAGKATLKKEEVPAQQSEQSSSQPEDPNRSTFTYTITFQEQTITTLSFTSNFSGTRRIRDYLMFVFEGSSHSGDIDLFM